MPIRKVLANLFLFLLPLLLMMPILAQAQAHRVTRKPPRVKAQAPYLYEFNKNFELLKGPPPIFVAGSKFDVRIAFDTVLFRGQIDSLLLNIVQARVYWLGWIKKIKLNTSEGYQWRVEIQQLLTDLGNLYDGLAGKTMKQLLDPDFAGQDDCVNGYKYTPCPKYVAQWLRKQISLKLKPSKTEYCLIPTELKDSGCIWFYRLADSPRTVNENLTLYLYKENSYNSMVIDWYSSHISKFPYFEFALYEAAVQKQGTLFSDLKKYSSTDLYKKDMSAKDCKDLIATLNGLIDGLAKSDFADAYADLNDKMPDLRAWILGNVWIAKGTQVQLNPLGFTSAGLYRDQSKKTPKDKTDSLVLLKLANLLDSNKIDLKNYKDLLAVWYRRDSAKNRQDSLQTVASKSQQASGTQGGQANQQVLAAFEQTSVLMNIVRTPVAGPKQPKLNLRNYYFNQRPDRRDFHYDYPEDELVVLAIHNRPASLGITVSSQNVVFNELTGINEQVAETTPSALGKVGAAAGLASTLNPHVLADENGKQSLEGIINGEGGKFSGHERNTKPPDCETEYKEQRDKLSKQFSKYRFWDSLYNLAPIPPQILERTTFDSTRMYTDVFFPDRIQKAPTQAMYVLSVKDTSKSLSLLNPIDSSGYRVGKRRLVELALGVAYSLTSVRQVNVDRDPASGNLLPSSTETKEQFVVGLKFHLWRKIYWENNKFAFSCTSLKDETWKERLSLFIGASIPSPLNNIYTGAGVDLIPGLNLTVGAQWYQYYKYGINNNQVINKTSVYRPALFLAVTADPTVVVNIVKTFFN